MIKKQKALTTPIPIIIFWLFHEVRALRQISYVILKLRPEFIRLAPREIFKTLDQSASNTVLAITDFVGAAGTAKTLTGTVTGRRNQIKTDYSRCRETVILTIILTLSLLQLLMRAPCRPERQASILKAAVMNIPLLLLMRYSQPVQKQTRRPAIGGGILHRQPHSLMTVLLRGERLLPVVAV